MHQYINYTFHLFWTYFLGNVFWACDERWRMCMVWQALLYGLSLPIHLTRLALMSCALTCLCFDICAQCGALYDASWVRIEASWVRIEAHSILSAQHCILHLAFHFMLKLHIFMGSLILHVPSKFPRTLLGWWCSCADRPFFVVLSLWLVRCMSCWPRPSFVPQVMSMSIYTYQILVASYDPAYELNKNKKNRGGPVVFHGIRGRCKRERELESTLFECCLLPAQLQCALAKFCLEWDRICDAHRCSSFSGGPPPQNLSWWHRLSWLRERWMYWEENKMNVLRRNKSLS